MWYSVCLALMPTGEIIETKWSTTRLPHLLIRSIAVVNLIDAGLEFVYPRYGHALANGPFVMFVVVWFVVTSIALPVFVVVESTWIREKRVSLRAVRIDAVFAVAWFLVFWISMLYAFTHNLWWL